MARALFDEALRAADPAQALRRAIKVHPLPEPDPDGRQIVVAVGKAAGAMMTEALAHLPAAPATEAIVVTNHENAGAIAGAAVFAAGHPVPDENGLAAGQAVIAALGRATAADRVIALISGGGSALLPAPAEGLTLADKARVNELMLAAGADITEMNLIRQQLSRLKGGGMTRLAYPATVTAYVLSDVIGDDLRVIASGPTEAPLGTAADARRLLEGRGLWPRLPEAVRAHLGRADPLPPSPVPAATHLIGSNGHSLAAIRDAVPAGWRVEIASDRLTGDVGDACAAIQAAVAATPADRPICLIFGGETTVTLTGDGRGGRNQELALRMAMAMRGEGWVLLSGGTDGRDGPTDAAGGIVDSQTMARMRAAGADPQALLANNDSYRALAASGDLLVTGATGTNVADVQIFLRRPV
ncbi:MAG: DUF4147 domain-containing protein [Paracoccaceae bacterium]